MVESSSFQTVEALAVNIAECICSNGPVDTFSVSVEKPSALALVDGAGVEISGHRDMIAASTRRFG
jgi:dihydroneopterin aldolase